jgi:Zn-dependent M32 family carboxypeptidase
MKTARTKGKVRPKVKNSGIGISREVWEWAKANSRFEDLMEELEDLEDLRREKAKKEKGLPFAQILKEYELTHQNSLK